MLGDEVGFGVVVEVGVWGVVAEVEAARLGCWWWILRIVDVVVRIFLRVGIETTMDDGSRLLEVEEFWRRNIMEG